MKFPIEVAVDELMLVHIQWVVVLKIAHILKLK